MNDVTLKILLCIVGAVAHYGYAQAQNLGLLKSNRLRDLKEQLDPAFVHRILTVLSANQPARVTTTPQNPFLLNAPKSTTQKLEEELGIIRRYRDRVRHDEGHTGSSEAENLLTPAHEVNRHSALPTFTIKRATVQQLVKDNSKAQQTAFLKDRRLPNVHRHLALATNDSANDRPQNYTNSAPIYVRLHIANPNLDKTATSFKQLPIYQPQTQLGLPKFDPKFIGRSAPMSLYEPPIISSLQAPPTFQQTLRLQQQQQQQQALVNTPRNNNIPPLFPRLRRLFSQNVQQLNTFMNRFSDTRGSRNFVR